MKKILIICYSFPPHPGIGGRRWAKFAKYIKQAGYDVSVIASENPYSDKVSEWCRDVEGIPVLQLPLNFPKALITFPGGIIGKIKYRLGLMKVKRLSRGNYYDRTIFWREQLIEAYKNIINKEQISHVIISGAPFAWFNFVNDLRRLNPSVKFIADIRDPWIENESAYGYTSMSPERLQYEKNSEKAVPANFDRIITVNDHISEYFKKLSPGRTDRISTLPNGYDGEETETVFPKELSWDDSKINMVFTGSFYGNALYLFEALTESLIGLQKKGTEIPFRFYFFSPQAEALKTKVPASLAALFHFGYFTTIAHVNAVISRANYGMLFLTDDINNSLSTKFCEYIKFKKKVLVFSKPGFTAEYVEKNQVGYFLEKGKITEAFEKIATVQQPEQLPSGFDTDQFSLKRLTKQLIELMEQTTV